MKIDETHKRCFSCKEIKTLLEFYSSKNGCQKVQGVCKKCSCERVIKWQNIEPTGRIYRLWSNAKKNAKKKDVEFTITKEWIKEKVERGVCERTGIPFELYLKTGYSGSKKAFGPSLDRTDQTLGYTPDNVKMVVWIYNLAKGTGKHEDVLKLAEGVMKYARTQELKNTVTGRNGLSGVRI